MKEIVFDNFELYKAVRRIADIVFEEAHKIPETITEADHLSIEDRRGERVNPLFRQTERGVYLDFHFSNKPSCLWTPWGEWPFTGSAGYSGLGMQRLVEAVMNRLQTTIHRHENPTAFRKSGELGPTYAVLRVDDIQLPEPTLKPSNAYLSSKDALEAWANYTRQYQDSQK